MAYTLSWHQGGQNRVRQAHNRRTPHALGHSSTIDSSRTKDNITLRDIPIREAYERLFGAAVEEYNDRARESRQIGDYYTQVCKGNKQAAYEVVVQIGSRADGSPEKAVDALQRYVREWGRRNPNLALIGAYIHRDEPAGTVHAHLDYIPVAECSRGMRLQNSLTGALGAQGFKTKHSRDTAQQQWQQSERDAMRSICRDMDIDLAAQGHGRDYMEIADYKKYADSLNRIKSTLQCCQQTVAALEGQIGDQYAELGEAQAERQEMRQEIRRMERQLADLQHDANIMQEQQNEVDQMYYVFGTLEQEYPEYLQGVLQSWSEEREEESRAAYYADEPEL